jgi:5'-nucleotidase
MNILVDVDGVVVDTTGEVLRRYNIDYGDSLTNEDVLDWYTHKFVKPQCGKRVYGYYAEKDLYDKLEPIEGAVEAISALRENHRVIFVTSGFFFGKIKFLKRHGFIDDVKYDKNLIFAHSKDLILGDLLIDDRIENCLGRPSLLFDQPWNRKAIRMPIAYGWENVLEELEAFYG